MQIGENVVDLFYCGGLKYCCTHTRPILCSTVRCGPCRQIAPLFSQLSERYPSAVFLKVNVDEQEVGG